MTIEKAYQAIHVTSKFFVTLYPTLHPHPPPLRRDICDIVCISFKKYLKRRVIQLAIEWRVGQLTDYR